MSKDDKAFNLPASAQVIELEEIEKGRYALREKPRLATKLTKILKLRPFFRDR